VIQRDLVKTPRTSVRRSRSDLTDPDIARQPVRICIGTQ
jgi:hypothetical protein